MTVDCNWNVGKLRNIVKILSNIYSKVKIYMTSEEYTYKYGRDEEVLDGET